MLSVAALLPPSSADYKQQGGKKMDIRDVEAVAGMSVAHARDYLRRWSEANSLSSERVQLRYSRLYDQYVVLINLPTGIWVYYPNA
jgi:hypothetical protein